MKRYMEHYMEHYILLTFQEQGGVMGVAVSTVMSQQEDYNIVLNFCWGLSFFNVFNVCMFPPCSFPSQSRILG